MTAAAAVSADDLDLSFETVLFGAGEKGGGEDAPPRASSSSASAAAFSPAGGDGGVEHAGDAANANRRRFSAGAVRSQPHHPQQQQDGGGGGVVGPGRPRNNRNPRHSFSGCVGPTANQREEEGISKPYAFNYHYDNGVFRGLAFANYTTPEETDA
ncbi:MAG: hypothetical protein BJ554DRAFT_5556, partial [Olpidium bornovanus]